MADDPKHRPPTFVEKVRRQPKAIAHFSAAFVLSLIQEKIIFPEERRTPGKYGLRPMLLPENYPQLDGFVVQERQLVDQANGNVPVTIWEKEALPGKPHYFIFQGQVGHPADGGPAPKERYDNPETGRANGLQYMQAIAETGGGFTMVCLRGYGKTPGLPSEKAFNEDIAVVLNDFVGKGITGDRIIVGGESLGAASALEAALQFKARGITVAQVDLMNPFASMAEIAAESFDKIPELKHMPHFDAEFLKNKLLRHRFDNREKLRNLDKKTVVHVGTASRDKKIDHHHSTDLVALARQQGLDTIQTTFPSNNHRDWEPAHLLASSIVIYNKRHNIKNDEEMLNHLLTHDYNLQPVLEPDWKTRAAAAVDTRRAAHEHG